MESRTKNAKRNILSAGFNRIVSIIMPFVIRTVIINKLGMEYLGLDNLFTSILQILNLSELGISSAVVYCMYKPIVENDYKKVSALYNFIKKIYMCIAVFVLVVGIVILPFLKHFIAGNIPDDVNIYILYLIYLFNTVISYCLCAYKNALLNAFQRVDIVNNILTTSRFIMYLFQFMLLMIFSNYYTYIIILPICTFINNILTWIYTDKYFGQIKPEGKLDEKIKKELKKQIGGLFVTKLCTVSRNSFDSIIISSFLGLTMTAMYNNYYYILTAVLSMLIIFTSSIIPSVGNSIAINSVEKNYDDFNKFNFIYMWLVGVCCVILFNLYQPFMKLWVGEEKMLSILSVVLFCVYFYSLNIGSMRATYSEAAGLWWENRYKSVFEAFANLLLNIILGKIWGIYGVLIATIITIIFINFGMSGKILYDKYFVSYDIEKYFLNTLIYFCVMVLACIVSALIIYHIKLTGGVEMIVDFIISFAISNLIFYLSFRKREEYKISLLWIKRICKKEG